MAYTWNRTETMHGLQRIRPTWLRLHALSLNMTAMHWLPLIRRDPIRCSWYILGSTSTHLPLIVGIACYWPALLHSIPRHVIMSRFEPLVCVCRRALHCSDRSIDRSKQFYKDSRPLLLSFGHWIEASTALRSTTNCNLTGFSLHFSMAKLYGGLEG